MTKISTFLRNFIKNYWFVILSTVVIFAIVAVIELYSGRSPLGPDGHFGWWDGDIWSSENSQRVADVYSFSHIIHGMFFYGMFWFIAKRLPERLKSKFTWKYWFLGALILEAGWELLENSPLIINRYREATIAQGYVGDSVLNSVCDVGMVVIGFAMAKLSKIWATILLVIVFEVGCLLWVRDNLTLNVLMLVYPSQSIKAWQSEGREQLGTTTIMSTDLIGEVK